MGEIVDAQSTRAYARARSAEPVPLLLFEETIRVQRAVRAAIDAELQPLRLRIQEYRALTELRLNPSISGVELARRLQHSPQAVQPLLARLEQAELIERRPGVPRSNLESRLTQRGEEILAVADHVVSALNGRVNERLGSSTTAALLHLLEAAHAAVDSSRLRVQSDESGEPTTAELD